MSLAKLIVTLIVGLTSLALGACGGGSQSAPQQAARGGTTPHGKTSAGPLGSEEAAGPQETVLSDQAQRDWSAANAAFNNFEKKGWSKAGCDDVVDKYETAVDKQGGKFAEAIYMQGLVHDRCANHAKAMELYRHALEIDPRLCKAKVAIGVDAVDRGDKSSAFGIFEGAIKADPQCTEGYVNLAVLQRERGGAGVKDALNNLRRALAIDARYLPAFNEMALLYLEQSKTKPELLELAAVVCRQAQLVDRDYGAIYNTWGLVYMQKGNIIEAARMFEKALTLDNQIVEAFINFAQLTLSYRGFEDAHKAFERAAQLSPKIYEIRLGLGASLRGFTRHPDDIDQYKTAIPPAAARPEAYYNLGILYQGYMSGSIADLESAKRYYGEFLNRAGGSFGQEVKDLKATCQLGGTSKRAKRQAAGCKPGRLQVIDMALAALRAAKS